MTMKCGSQKRRLSARVTTMTLLSLLLVVSHGFVTPSSTLVCRPISATSAIATTTSSRGGAIQVLPNALLSAASVQDGVSLVTSSLQSGPFGVLGLSAVIWSVVLPLTLYKKIYGIGVAYGFSVCAAGVTLLKLFPLSTAADGGSGIVAGALLAKACIFYGARLGSYLLLRDATMKNKPSISNGSIISRVIFSYSLALFYSFLTTPALYASRNPVSSTSIVLSSIALAGSVLAWIGASLEAVADAQKFVVKQSNQKDEDTSSSSISVFVGPTSWAYRISRHPNYLGEVLFWTGMFIGGMPSFEKSIPAWICSSLGLFGIVSIMTTATSKLETKQEEKYGGQEKYESWKQKVPYALFPFLS